MKQNGESGAFRMILVNAVGGRWAGSCSGRDKETAGQHAGRTWYNVDGGHIYARQVEDVTWT